MDSKQAQIDELANIMEAQSLQQQIDEVTEWLETHEIDDPEYDQKFSELKRLEEEEDEAY
jgi:NAD-dependent DNA ligase